MDVKKCKFIKEKHQENYSREFKAETMKLAGEIGKLKASKGLGIPEGTLYGWIKKLRL